MEVATAGEAPAAEACSSFSKAMFLGEIHEELVFPWPQPDPSEQDRIRALIASLRELAESIDPREIEEKRWIGDKLVRELGERGLCGLYVPEQYGGQGLSQTGYARVFEAFALVDATLSIVMGVHQSIGFKGILMFGTDEQKERFLPDLAAGRKLAGFALTEPNAGSDAYNIESRAVLESDGSWRLNGEKRFIGNGEKGSVLTTFARCEIDGKDRHIALILEKGMKGFEVGERYDTMGLRGNDLRRLHFNDVRVPPENVLGDPGEGFRIAMEILNNGRIGLGTGSVGATKGLLDRAIDHVKERRQFGAPLADLELVQDKIGWMVSYLFGLESMAYLTCGLVDAGVPDYSLESAVCKVSGTEFLWYAANRVLQLKGGEGYLRDQPYEKVLRDIRIFPIFEGANDVLRSFVALSGMKPLGEKLSGLGELDLSDPIGSIGVLIDYVGGRIQREVLPDKVTRAHPELEEPRGRRLRPGEAASRRQRVAASQAWARDRPQRLPAQAHRRLARRHLRADRGALPGQLDLRGPGRRAVGPGALHRRDLLHAGRRSRSRPLRPDRAQRRRADVRDRQARLQARRVRLRAVRGLTPAATQASPARSDRRPARRRRAAPRSGRRLPTRVRRYRTAAVAWLSSRRTAPPQLSASGLRLGEGAAEDVAQHALIGLRQPGEGLRRHGHAPVELLAQPPPVRGQRDQLHATVVLGQPRSTRPRSSSRSTIPVMFELSQCIASASSPIWRGSASSRTTIACPG